MDRLLLCLSLVLPMTMLRRGINLSYQSVNQFSIKYNNMKIVFLSFGLVCALGLSACAGSLPVPGGDEQINQKTDASHEDLLNRVNNLRTGMSVDLVLAVLKRSEADLIHLSRAEIMSTLYGGTSSGFDGTYEEQERARAFLQTLTGFKILYVNTEKEHGFSSPIRIKTHESGYSYTLALIFQNGTLFDQPILSGGVVDGYSSKTVFDYLNPGSFLGMR